MRLDEAHIAYLEGHDLGHLATVAADGHPQNKPVGYRYNEELGTIDIAGFEMEHSAKYRNIGINPDVAFVVDDAIGEGAAAMRFLEIRGPAEQALGATADVHLIRIHLRRMVSWNVDSARPGLQAYNLDADH